MKQGAQRKRRFKRIVAYNSIQMRIEEHCKKLYIRFDLYCQCAEYSGTIKEISQNVHIAIKDSE